MRRNAGILALLALAWLMMTGAVGACDLFRPATPEQGGGGVVVLTNYTDFESTLVTIARGINAKGDGRDAYMGGIADTTRDLRTFFGFFDPLVADRYNAQPGATGGWDPWTTDLERTFFFNFVQYKSTPYSMTWGPDNNHLVEDKGTDFALLHRAYRVTTRLSDGTDQIIAVGYADLTFSRTASGRWVIVRWADRVDNDYGANPSNPEQVCWGWRRLTLR